MRNFPLIRMTAEFRKIEFNVIKIGKSLFNKNHATFLEKNTMKIF